MRGALLVGDARRKRLRPHADRNAEPCACLRRRRRRRRGRDAPAARRSARHRPRPEARRRAARRAWCGASCRSCSARKDRRAGSSRPDACAAPASACRPAARAPPRLACALELGIEEAEIEHRVVRDQRRVADETRPAPRPFCANSGLSLRNSTLSPCTLNAAVRHVAFRIEIAVERVAGRKTVDQLDAADLDQPVARDRDRARWSRCRTRSRASRLSPRGESNYRRFGILATAARICRTWARAGSIPCELSTTKSARRRFSASGICRASNASSRSRLDARAPARRRAARRPAPRPPPPHRPASRRRSRTAAEYRARPPWRRRLGLAQEPRSRPPRTSGCTIASSRRSAARVADHALGQARSGRPCRPVTPGNAASIGATASPS